MNKKLILLLIAIFLLFINNSAQNLVLYTTLDDAASITSPSTGPAGTRNSGSFSAAQYNDGFLSDANNEYVTFDIGASTGTESGKLNQNKGTIAFWFKPNFNSGSVGVGYFFMIGTFSSPYSQVIYLQYFANFSLTQLKILINGSAKAIDNFASTSWSANDLVHIAIVWDASGSNSNIDGGNSNAIYINGSITASNNSTWTPVATNATDLYIGCASNGSSYPARGVIDDFFIYDDVLTSAQINSLKDSQVLPVELSSFSANLVNQAVELNWETATEVNNFGFEILRSAQNDSTWDNIGFVQGNGTTNSPKNYEFTDSELPNVESVDYRLKQIDNDGSFEYSKIVTVDLTNITSVNDDKQYTFSLEQNYPNPFNPSTTIKFTIPTDVKGQTADVKLIVFDILGREVAILVNQKLQPGNHEVNFDASNLSSGIYLYKIVMGEKLSSIKKMLLIR